jgi:hypothetical protein
LGFRSDGKGTAPGLSLLPPLLLWLDLAPAGSGLLSFFFGLSVSTEAPLQTDAEAFLEADDVDVDEDFFEGLSSEQLAWRCLRSGTGLPDYSWHSIPKMR